MLFTGREVRTGKIFCRGLKIVYVFETETKHFPSTDRPKR